jgi:hypothetical protein
VHEIVIGVACIDARFPKFMKHPGKARKVVVLEQTQIREKGINLAFFA